MIDSKTIPPGNALRNPAHAYLRLPITQAALVGLIFFALFVSLRTHQYTAVDGALRCLEVYQRQELFLHANNHLLYPAHVFFWHRLLSIFGLRANGPIEFVELTQLMNCLAAAGCLAIVYRLMISAVSSVAISLSVVLGIGLSRAFLLHATNSAEPMMGLFWSLLAVAVLTIGLNRERPWLLFVSGVLLALAMATYGTMVLIAPVMAILCLKWSTASGGRIPRFGSSLTRVSLVATGGLAGIIVIYGLAHGLSTSSRPMTTADRFLLFRSYATYLAPEMRKIANLPLGLVGNLFPVLPPDFEGIRSLLRRHDNWMLLVGLALAGVFIFLSLNLLRAWRWRARLGHHERLILVSAVLGGTVTLAAPYFFPQYDKFWLQPIVCIVFLSGVLVKVNFQSRFGLPVKVLGMLLLTTAVVSNLAWAVPSRLGQTGYLQEAEQVAQIVNSEDFVVVDWDDISVLYASIWGQGQTYNLPTEAHWHGKNVIEKIHAAANEARRRGGQVYFLGVLDQTADRWNNFMDRKFGVPYQLFDPFRERAVVVTQFKYRDTFITLRRLDQSSIEYSVQLQKNRPPGTIAAAQTMRLSR